MTDVVFKRRLRFVDYVILLARSENSIKQKVYLLENISYYMANYHCGVFRYEPIEQLMQDIGNELVTDSFVIEKNNHFLHIMTKASVTGGHTSVVENFIKNRRGYNEEHHLLLVSQYDEIKPGFCHELDSNNKLFDISSMGVEDKIKEISRISQEYEYVILHHHMYDVLPIIALSKFKNKKNIFVYNHADHLYWVGSSIVSRTLEMSTDGARFSTTRRGVVDACVLPIPLIKKEKNLVKNIREKLNISSQHKVILTIGNKNRFITEKYSYKDVVRDVIENKSDIYFVIIGDHDESFWGDLWSCPRIIFIGVVPKDELDAYYSMADLYLDSFPMGGSTATLDALCYGVPSIKVEHIFFEFDSLKPFVVKCNDIVSKIFEIFDKQKEDNLGGITVHFHDEWNLRLNTIISKSLPSNLGSSISSHSKYDNDLYSFQKEQGKRIVNNKFKNLSLKNAVLYFIGIIMSFLK
ncbi:hypothetical protein ACV1EH_05065 [Aeromonas caviae]|uniref:hypothetical protein n=1 Tax=Aeromonas caviae TaxID=648 RepID=UPI003F743BFC